MTFEEWYKKNKSPNEYIGNVSLKETYKFAEGVLKTHAGRAIDNQTSSET